MKRHVVAIAAAGLGAAIMLIAVLWASAVDEPLGLFTRDLRVISSERGAHLPYYAGSVAMATNFVWAVGATLTAVVAILLRLNRWWYAGLSLLLMMLALDDAYMLHESVGPYHGIPEIAFYVVYAVMALALALPLVKPGHRPILFVYVGGMGMLGVGMLADIFMDDPYLLEDGLKLMGAMVLATIAVRPMVEIRQALWASYAAAEIADRAARRQGIEPDGIAGRSR